MKAALIAVGNEVLFGDTVNTNAAFLAAQLTQSGVEVVRQAVVPDALADVAASIHDALAAADLVVLIGGLGPTVDDLTRQALALATDRPLHEDGAALTEIEGYFRERRRPMPVSNRQQALVPEGGQLLPNQRGTAPGLWLEVDGRVLVALPGPPIELEPMFQEAVLPRLLPRLGGGRRVIWVRTSGIGESSLQELLGDLLTTANPSLLPYAKLGEVHLRILADGKSQEAADQAAQGLLEAVRSRIAAYIYGLGDLTLEEVILRRLGARAQTVAVAESASGGLVSERLSAVAGASRVFLGGTVVYTAGAKARWAGLDPELLSREGPVSAFTASHLALAVRRELGAGWGVATCGWAGPEADGEIGLAYTAVAGEDGVACREHRLGRNRYDIRHRLAQAALWQLYQTLGEES